MRLEVKSRTELEGVPSASGIEFYGDSFYIIGDNSAWLFRYNASFRKLEKYPVHAQLNSLNDTIPKKEKPDFEATTVVLQNTSAQLLIFGSGSKSPMRDILVKVDLNNPTNVESLSLEKFYALLKSGGVTELNIEGAVYANEFLYLLNRADNSIIRFAYNEFELFLTNANHPLEFTLHKFSLPHVDDVQVAFSGGTLIPGTGTLIFTASAEKTENWIDDGAILGSYAGIIELENLTDFNKPQVVSIQEDGNALQIKIESVTVKSSTRHKIQLVMVTDSDGGPSELIEANLFME
ncbi:MAG: hypothetical protein IPO32_01170 [Crocinitomicaceae bacterium]|nr:hypothetical protein [Crocinitomicaceae bacterium]MBK9590142.1 hypothetical protein [Crocinitomicaceae bacterium]